MRSKIYVWSVILLGLTNALVTNTASAATPVVPEQLRCDYVVNPLGVDSVVPRLFWELAGDARGERQTGYEILVATAIAR